MIVLIAAIKSFKTNLEKELKTKLLKLNVDDLAKKEEDLIKLLTAYVEWLFVKTGKV